SAQPVCSPTANACVQCTADDAKACVGNRPACNTTTNVCAGCDGDNGTGASSQCADGHPGSICDTVSGACGTSCNESSECPAADWCNAAMGASGACVAKLADGTSLPPSPP